MGHVLEHLLPGAARSLLALLCDRLPPGAVVSAVVPDMRAIFAAYERGEVSNDDLNARFVYSYVQPSHHLWCHDLESLTSLFQEAGFRDIEPIDPSEWEPVYWKEGDESRWQCGVRATATGTPTASRWRTAAPRRPPSAPADRRPPVAGGGRRPTSTRDRRGDAAGAGAHAQGGAAEGVGPGPGPGGGRPPRSRRRRPAPPPGPGVRRRSATAPATAAPLRARDVRAVAKQLLPRAPAAGCWPAPCSPPAGSCSAPRPGWASCGAGRASSRPPPSPTGGGRGTTTPLTTSWPTRCNGWRRTADPLRVAVLVAQRRRRRGPGPQPQGAGQAVVAELGGAGHHPARQPRRPAAPVPRPPHPVGRLGRGRLRGTTSTGSRASPTTPASWCSSRPATSSPPTASTRWPATPAATRSSTSSYWDDDVGAVGSVGGFRHDPRFRPGWSPDMLAQRQLRRPLVRHPAGPVRPRRGRAAALGAGPAVGDAAAQPARRDPGLPRHPGARPPPRRRDDTVDEQGLAVVNAHLAERGVPAEATLVGGQVRLRWDLAERPRVSRSSSPPATTGPWSAAACASLARTDYPDFDVVVDRQRRGHGGERGLVRASSADLDLAVHWWTEPFNYSAVNNLGAAKASGDVLVFLNDDTEVLDPGWMTELVGWARQPDIGVVGLQLLDRDGELQHAGAIARPRRASPTTSSRAWRPAIPTPARAAPTWYRNVLAVTGACLGVEPGPVRGDGRLRRALHAVRQRRRPRPRRPPPGPPQPVLAARRRAPPRVGHPRHPRPATRTSSPATGATSSGSSAATPTSRPTCRWAAGCPSCGAATSRRPPTACRCPLGRNFEAFRQKSDSGEAYMLAGTCRARPRSTSGR